MSRTTNGRRFRSCSGSRRVSRRDWSPSFPRERPTRRIQTYSRTAVRRPEKIPESRPGLSMRATPVRWHCAQTLSRRSADNFRGFTMPSPPSTVPVFIFATCSSPEPWHRSQPIPPSRKAGSANPFSVPASGCKRLAWQRRQAGSTGRVKMKTIVVLIARRKVPPLIRGVVGHGRLVKKTVDREEIAAANRSRSDEIFKQPGPLNLYIGIGEIEIERRLVSVLIDAISDSGWSVREFRLFRSSRQSCRCRSGRCSEPSGCAYNLRRCWHGMAHRLHCRSPRLRRRRREPQAEVARRCRSIRRV